MSLIRTALLGIGLVATAAGCTHAAAPGNARLPAQTVVEIDRLFADALEARDMPGASVAVAFPDGRLFSRHYGSASLQAGVAVTGQTRFRLGSISKLVTALAIMKLVEEGRLQLDIPVAALLPHRPEMVALPASLTVRTLLNHTSGLPDFTRSELEAKVGRGVSTDADLSAVLRRSLRHEPGGEWVYSDAGFRVLSLVVEQVSGLPFERYLAERLVPELGLPSLSLCEPGMPNMASGYLSHDNDLMPEPAYSIRGLLGEGGLCATVEDLARLPGKVASGSWINRSSLETMLAPTRLTGGELVDYGFGVRGGWLGDVRGWGHTGGGLHGSWASFVHYPESGVTVAVAANGTGSGTDAATLQAAVAASVLRMAPPEGEPLDPNISRSLAGAYRRGEQMTCILPSGGGLIRTRISAAATPTRLLYQGESSFARSDFPLDRIVFQIEGETAIGYRVYYDGLFGEYWRRVSDAGCGEADPAR